MRGAGEQSPAPLFLHALESRIPNPESRAPSLTSPWPLAPSMIARVNLSVERRHVTIGSRTLSYLAVGPRQGMGTVVFLHAFPLNAAMWLPQLRALPEGWAGVAPDFRGFGDSTPDDEGAARAHARLEDYADDVVALMDELGVPRAALCGCSMGGYAAFAVVRRVPDRVAGLLLADTRAAADTDAGRASRAAMLELARPRRPRGDRRRDAPEARRDPRRRRSVPTCWRRSTA